MVRNWSPMSVPACPAKSSDGMASIGTVDSVTERGCARLPTTTTSSSNCGGGGSGGSSCPVCWSCPVCCSCPVCWPCSVCRSCSSGRVCPVCVWCRPGRPGALALRAVVDHWTQNTRPRTSTVCRDARTKAPMIAGWASMVSYLASVTDSTVGPARVRGCPGASAAVASGSCRAAFQDARARHSADVCSAVRDAGRPASRIP